MDCYGFLTLGGGILRLRLVIVRYRESYVDAFSVRCSDFASAGIELFEYLVRLYFEGGFMRVLEMWRSCMMYFGAGYACFLCIKCRYRAELFLKPTFSFLTWFCVGGFGIQSFALLRILCKVSAGCSAGAVSTCDVLVNDNHRVTEFHRQSDA